MKLRLLLLPLLPLLATVPAAADEFDDCISPPVAPDAPTPIEDGGGGGGGGGGGPRLAGLLLLLLLDPDLECDSHAMMNSPPSTQ